MSPRDRHRNHHSWRKNPSPSARAKLELKVLVLVWVWAAPVSIAGMRDLGFTNRHQTSQNHTGFPGKWKGKDVFFTSVVLVGVSCVCFPHQKKEFVQDTTFFAKSELGVP